MTQATRWKGVRTLLKKFSNWFSKREEDLFALVASLTVLSWFAMGAWCIRIGDGRPLTKLLVSEVVLYILLSFIVLFVMSVWELVGVIMAFAKGKSKEYH